MMLHMPCVNIESIQQQSTASLTDSSMLQDGVGLQADEERFKKEDPPVEVFEDTQYGATEISSLDVHLRRRFSISPYYKQEAEKPNSLEYQNERPSSNNSNNEDDDYYDDNEVNTYELPESTFTFLITEKIMSFGFFTGILTTILCVTTLGLAFVDQVKNGAPDNWFGISPEVSPVVHVARYVAILIAVLNEQEIPTALELIGKGVEQILPSSTGEVISMGRILFSSILRMFLGMCFFVTMFVCVIQSRSVLEIFFNVLALEFVENIDDAIFALSRRGFFGHPLMMATRPRYIKTVKQDHGQPLSTASLRTKRCIRLVYTFSVCIG